MLYNKYPKRKGVNSKKCRIRKNVTYKVGATPLCPDKETVSLNTLI